MFLQRSCMVIWRKIYKKDEALHLCHAIYVLGQAARRFYLRFIETLKILVSKVCIVIHA